MSGKRPDSGDSPLCRFAFADGRHCRLPAHPDYDGLCYAHGTLAPRASRQDNLDAVLAPLANGPVSTKDLRRASRALARALANRRISLEQAAVLTRLSYVIRLSRRYVQQDSLRSASGPEWDKVRQILDRSSSPEES